MQEVPFIDQTASKWIAFEQEGTYKLPEAQLNRFLMKIQVS